MRVAAHTAAVALCTVSVIPSSWALNGAQLPGYFAINESMGGAGVAVPLDGSVLVLNPAGLLKIPRVVNFNLTWGVPQSQMSSSASLAGNPGATGANGLDDPPFLPSATIVSPIAERWALGMGVVSAAGFGAEFGVSRLGAAVNTFDTFTNYSLLKFINAAAYRINDQITAGAAFHFNRAVLETDSATAAGTETIGGGVPDAAIGAGFSVGLLYEPYEFLSAGVSYTSEQFFQDFERYTDILPNGANYPQQVAVGVGLRPIEKWIVAGDFRWINWSGAGGGLGTPIASGGFGWRDQYIFMGGTQYDLFKWMILRAGYNYGRTMIGPEAAFTNAIVGAGGRHHIAGGGGFRFWKNIDLDASYVYTLRAGVTDDGSVNPAFAGTSISTAVHQGSLAVGVRF